MRIKKQKELRIRHGWRHRSIAALLVLSMLFCQININVMAAYATGSDSVSVQVGDKGNTEEWSPYYFWKRRYG